MRKISLVAALLATALLVAPASALVLDVNGLPIGSWQAKYSDYSDLYLANPAGAGAMVPQLFGTGLPTTAAENRAIFYTTSIQPNSGPPAVWLPVTQEVTGLFYNLSLAFVNPTFTGGNLSALDLYFEQSTRNPLPGTPAGFGGVIEIYRDTAPNFSASPGGVPNLTVPVGGVSTATVNAGLGAWGPSFWVEGAGGLAGRDSYVGVSDGGLWLSGTFVDWATLALVDPAMATQLAALQTLAGDPTLDPVFYEHLDLSTGTGSGTGDIYLLGGSFFPSLAKGNMGLGPWVDMTLLSDLSTPKVDFVNGTLSPSNGTYGGAGKWPVDSQDPVSFNIIPEPATMTLLGLGLLGIGGIRRRLKKS